MNVHSIQVLRQDRNSFSKTGGYNKLSVEALSKPQFVGEISGVFINSHIVTVILSKKRLEVIRVSNS